MENKNLPRDEYPRPDMKRKEWVNLNGEWKFEFDDNNIGEKEGWYKSGLFTKKIIVPFCYQSKMSGVGCHERHEFMWYSREFHIPEHMLDKRIILNFGAVDYLSRVWVNGEYIGEHKGGYTPFKFDITRFVKKGRNQLVLKVEDRYECVQPRGKQYWNDKPDRCWYTPTSGIWQTVWLDFLGEIYIDKIRITPNIDLRNITMEIYLNEICENLQLFTNIYYKDILVKSTNTDISDRISRITINIKEYDYVDEIHYWTPENPNLYDVVFELKKNGEKMDFVESYFGMRKISVKGDLILLNNKPYYQKLILDQGYWPESLLTPPSDEAIKYDIEITKKLGFNGARKHQKAEDPRYYYWADRLGLLVWGEMPSGYDFNSEEMGNIIKEWMEFINRDYNHPSIITWVPLNESWGVRNIYVDKNQQDFARSLYYITKALDGTRLISTNDGWEQVESDICGIHDYFARGEDFISRYKDKEKLVERDAQGRILYCEGVKYSGQPVLITEYGGIAFDTGDEGNWGYNDMVRDEESFFKRYYDITTAVKSIPYIRGYCYTQLTDVQQEVNGLMTADRKLKVSLDRVAEINRL